MIKCNDVAFAALLDADDEQFGSTVDGMEVEQHVAACSCCQRRLSQLAAEDRQWEEIPKWLSHDERFEEIRDESFDARERWNRPIAWTESMANSLLSQPSHPELLGRIGRYDVERLIGSGGMGVVFKAYDTELNRPVAVKLLAPYLAGNGSARKRFAREARSAAGVIDDHVVPIYNVETENDPPFLVMQYVAGGSLQSTLDRDGPFDVCEILRIGMQTAKGLAAAHAQGLIHRDVKPSNILLDEGVERALLTDFGLARAENDACLTRSGFHPGTPHYMSPEQVRGEAIDGGSDLFGLGCVLYALCTGHPPFRAETSYAVLRRITDDTARPIRELSPNIPEWLEQIVMKLLSKSRDDRFDSADEVAELLEDCLAHVQHPTTLPLPECVSVSSPARGSRPPWGKFIGAAAFGFSMLLAGFLIVLEMNKGTLTIESAVGDVPIQIMQGDEVVRKLTVTKGSESVRIAAGEYVVMVDGPTDAITTYHGQVSLHRGDTEVVKVIHAARPSNAPTHHAEKEFGTIDLTQGPKVGETFLLRLTGSVATMYAESVGTIGINPETNGLEIEIPATVARRLSDGRLRIEHRSPPRITSKGHHVTLLTATTDPAAFLREITPRGTEVQASPDASIASPTTKETHSYRFTLSNFGEVMLKRLIEPLPPKADAPSELQFKQTGVVVATTYFSVKLKSDEDGLAIFYIPENDKLVKHKVGQLLVGDQVAILWGREDGRKWVRNISGEDLP